MRNFTEIRLIYSVDIVALDTAMSTPPTAEWQEQLYRRLAGTPGSGIGSPLTPYSTASEQTRVTSWSSSSSSTSPNVAMPTSLPGMSGEPSRRRRRIDNPYAPAALQQSPQPPFERRGTSDESVQLTAESNRFSCFQTMKEITKRPSMRWDTCLSMKTKR